SKQKHSQTNLMVKHSQKALIMVLKSYVETRMVTLMQQRWQEKREG
ncbi:hypothetical protein TVAGG3_0315340, partial [Trichomonas vaginalis G3]